MAIPSTQVWECRTDGNSTNGGGFDPSVASPGTDYSQQAAAQIAYTDLVIDGAINTNVTSAAHPFTAAHVGNTVNVTGGTGFTAGRYSVRSVDGSNVATMDRAVGTLGSTGGTGNLGGAVADIMNLTGVVAGNTIWLRGGTYSYAGDRNFNFAGSDILPIVIRGYNTTRGDLTLGDANRPTLRNSSGNICLNIMNVHNHIHDLTLDGQSTRQQGIVIAAAADYIVVYNCKATAVTYYGFAVSGRGCVFTLCEAVSCGAGSPTESTTPAGFYLSQGAGEMVYIDRCVSRSNTGHGINASTGTLIAHIDRCVINANTGLGIRFSGNNIQQHVTNCVINGNTLSGIYFPDTNPLSGCLFKNNLITNNSAYGIKSATTVLPAEFSAKHFYNNAYYNNTSGALYQIGAGTGDITLSADPYTNAAGLDFTLNDTAGGGDACIDAGVPVSLPSLTGTSYVDVGAYEMGQGAGTPAGGSGTVFEGLVVR